MSSIVVVRRFGPNRTDRDATACSGIFHHDHPRTIVLLAIEGVQLLDVSGPLDVFAEANAQAGRQVYALQVVGVRRGPIRSLIGRPAAAGSAGRG